ncbi:PREDICTED: E3 ubiquitin-protein ligase TRIM56-like, partial [Branchiostoma belcheri]|uniref:E3 ubiquitin-protein ligase TRIM56-like n=1 Tax=Branchiostoma belcheri TaxID=7741 RepID=A0A6P4YNA1_BRABE
MASALIKEISDDFLTCQICVEIFRKPKSLDCLHSFCEECLKEYVKPGETVVKCPTCQRDTPLKQNGVPELKDNFFILNLVDTIGARKKVQHSVDKLPCESCAGKGKVVSRCLTCNDFLCKSCVSGHKTMRAFKGHLVVTLDELRSGNYDGQTERKEPTCDTHPGEKMRFYCKTHSVTVCRDCTVLDHPKPEHNVINLTEAAKEIRSSTQQALKNLKEVLHETEEEIVATDKAIVDNQTECKKAEQLVDEKVSDIVTHVMKIGEQCKENVKADYGWEEKQKRAKKEELELKKVRLTSTAEFRESLLNHGTDIELATANKQIRECEDEL